jgi:Skp family chaperone for outer membrane proteins
MPQFSFYGHQSCIGLFSKVFFKNPKVIPEHIVTQMEVKKWQEKHDSSLKDLQTKESSLQRIEMELERTRHELERAKMSADKAETSKQLQHDQVNISRIPNSKFFYPRIGDACFPLCFWPMFYS